MESLHAVAAHGCELRGDLGAFDTLRDNLEAERMPERDDLLDDAPVRLVREHVHHEGLVDLDLVGRDLLQVSERGIAGAEIVDRDADAHLAQFRQHPVTALAIDHQRILGHLDREPVELDRRCAGGAA